MNLWFRRITTILTKSRHETVTNQKHNNTLGHYTGTGQDGRTVRDTQMDRHETVTN